MVIGHISADKSETKMAFRNTRKDVTIPKPAPGPTYAVTEAAIRSRIIMKKGSPHLEVSRSFGVIVFPPGEII